MRAFELLCKIRNLFLKQKGVRIGRIKNSILRTEYLTDSELSHHVHIVGASGFGKTVLLTKILRNRIEKGEGCLWIDLKGDRDTINEMTAFVEKSGRSKDIKIFSISHPELSGSYNLVSVGNATEIRDKIIGALSWSEEYYRNQSMSYLLKLLIVLVWLRDNKSENFDLSLVYEGLVSEDYLIGLRQKLPDNELQLLRCIEDCYQYLSKKETSGNLSGIRSQLESMLLADFGRFLKEQTDGIRLFEEVNSQKIVFIFLDSRRYGESARAIAKIIIKDLISTSAKVDDEIQKGARKQFTCFIDEFADIADEAFTAFPDRARSSKMSLVVSHQDLSDLKKVSETFYSRMTANISTLYAFLQSVPASAEEIAARAGTKTVWKETLKASKLWFFSMPTGDKSLRQVEEFLVHPNQVKSLRVGECVVVKKYPHSRAYVCGVDEKD